MPIPRCEICGSFLSCQTDSFQMVKGPDGKMHQGYGRMAYVHDGPCVRPSPQLNAPRLRTETKTCEECKQPFEADIESPALKICSPECRKKRAARGSRERYEASRARDGWPPVKKAPLAERFPNYFGRGAA